MNTVRRNYAQLLSRLQNMNKYNFKKVIVNLGEKNEKFTEILPNNNVTLKTQILTKGVFDITN